MVFFYFIFGWLRINPESEVIERLLTMEQSSNDAME